MEYFKTLNPNNSKLLKSINEIPTSRHTIERRISEINKDFETKLENDIKDCTAFSLLLDESTDITESPQLTIFIRFVFEDATLKEKLLDLITLKDTTRGIDIKEALDVTLKLKNIPREKLVAIEM
ncbi:Protein FAM200A [Anthophora plagiata]